MAKKPEIIKVDFLPLCPHCGKELDKIGQVSKGILVQSFIYVCPYCKKILSIGSNI